MERDDLYVLDALGRPQPVKDTLEWARWFEYAGERRRIAFDHLWRVTISTVFLGMDHNFFGGPPLLFETMVFGPDGRERWCKRWPTLEQAERGHAVAVKIFREGMPWWQRLLGRWAKALWVARRYEYDFASRRWEPI